MAYDEICGFNKEARVSESALLAQARNDPEMQELMRKTIAGDSEANKAYNQKFHDFAIAQRMKEIEERFDKKQKIKGPINNLKALRAFEKSNPELVANLVNGKISNDDYANANRNFMMDWEKNRLDKKWRKRHLGKYASEEFDDIAKCAYDEICNEIEKEAAIDTMNIEKLDKNIVKRQKRLNSPLGKIGYAARGMSGLQKMRNDKGKLAQMKLERQRREKTYGYGHSSLSEPSKVAEKAAAYYDEAQYVKEAAEADWAEACAYEDAAIQILDDLGYLD